MDLLEILSNVRSTGSGTGNSYYMEQCAARHQLDEQFPHEGGFDAQVGVLVHKLLELHYSRKLRDVALPLDDFGDFERDPVQEALRIYASYSKYFPDDEFDVVACELQIPEVQECPDCRGGPTWNGEPCVNCDDVGEVLTALGVLQQALLGDLVVRPYTLRPDMVVRFNEAQAAAWLERRKQTVTPGVYMVAHKPHKKAESDVVRAYSMGPQVPIYTRAYNKLCEAGLMVVGGVAQEPCQGLIINNMVRHMDMTPVATPRRAASFQAYLMDVGSELDVAVYSAHYRRQQEYLATGVPNPSQCRSFGRVCSHYETGRCNRLTPILPPANIAGQGGSTDARERE